MAKSKKPALVTQYLENSVKLLQENNAPSGIESLAASPRKKKLRRGSHGVAGFEQDTKRSLYTHGCDPINVCGSKASYTARHPPRPQRFVNIRRTVGRFGTMNGVPMIGYLSTSFGSNPGGEQLGDHR